MPDSKTMIALVTASLFAAACQQDGAAPTTPEPSNAVSSAAAPVDGEGCPCWSERTLAIAFDDAAFFFDHREEPGFRPGLSLQSVDRDAATMLEAWVEYDGSALDGSARACHLSTVGQEGLVDEIAAETDLTPAAYAACAESVLEAAAMAGLRGEPASDPASDPASEPKG